MSRALHLFGLLLIVVAAAFLRLWQIDVLPPGFHFDEAFEGLEAWRILIEPNYRPVFLTGNFGVLPLNAYTNAAMFGLFAFFGGEAGPTAMRVTAACFGVLGVLAVYGLGREMQRLDTMLSPLFPLWAAASLAGMRWHIHFSRMGIEPVLAPAVWAGAVALYLRGWRTGAWWAFAGSGVLLAAAMYAYQGAWVIPFLMAPLVVHLLLSRRLIAYPRRPFIAIALTAIVAALLFAPLALFIWRNVDLVLLRPAQVAVVGSTGSPADRSVLDNLWATVLMFGPIDGTGDSDPRRNLPGASALSLGLVIAFYIGLVAAVARLRRPIFAIPIVGLAGLLLPGVLSEYAPHFHRVVGATAPAALLCGIGLDWLWQRLPLQIPDRPASAARRRAGLAARLLAVLLLVSGIALSAYDYFARRAALPDLFYAFDVGLWEAGQWIARQQTGVPIYITPRDAEHATLASWPIQPTDKTQTAPPMPISFDGRHIFPFTAGPAQTPQQYIVIEPEDFRTRLLLPEVFPDAVVEHEILDPTGQAFARVYTRPAGSQPARAPRNPLRTEVGDGIRLVGYDLLPEVPRPGEMLYLQLHWQAAAAPAMDWTVFTHVINLTSGAVVAGHDSRPGAGSLPTPRWQPGWRILDEYQIPLPAELPPGEYGLRVGLYQNQERLPTIGNGVDLGTIVIQ